jgi:hypothetical protein
MIQRNVEQAMANMEPHGQSPWYLHDYPPTPRLRRVIRQQRNPSKQHSTSAQNDPGTTYAFTHGQGPWSSAQADKTSTLNTCQGG